MQLAGKVAVITGSGNGIGAAIAKRFADEGAKVLVTDIEADSVQRVADEIGTVGLAADVTVESEVARIAAYAGEQLGPIDIWHSNAGYSGPREPGSLQSDSTWELTWRLHVMSHVYAVRAVLPSMLQRGDGYLLATASSAALSTQGEKVAYAVTKHGALALSEWLAITYRPKGIKVSCYCPGAMLTRMFAANGFPEESLAHRSAFTPEQVAEVVVRGIESERFLILNRPEDANPLTAKATDYEAWLDARSGDFANLIGPV